MFARLLLSCAGDREETSTPTGTDPGDLIDLVVTQSEVVPSTYEIAWSSPSEGTSFVEFGLALSDRTTAEAPSSESHRHRLSLLKNNATIQWRAVTVLANGQRLQSGVNTLEVPPVPQEMPRLTLSVTTPDATVPTGHVVTTLIDATGGFAIVLDGDGDAVWWYDTGHAGAVPSDLVAFAPPGWDGHTLPVTARLDPEARDLLVQFYDGHQVDDIATLRRIPLDAMTAAEIVTTRTTLGHHDFQVLPGTDQVAWLAYQVEPVSGDAWASDIVLEAQEGNLGAIPATPIWSWHGDFPAEPYAFDPLQENFAISNLASFEWTHSNSLMYDAPSDSYFVMSKFLDCLIRVDRATGALLWVMGGQYSDFTLPGGGAVWDDLYDSHLWSHAHMSHLWYDEASQAGGFVLFDNGYYRPASSGTGYGWSRIAEYAFDENAGTVEEVWSYIEPNGAFTALMGDARKLEGDSYLLGWSSLGRIEELGADESVRWRVETGLGSITGRVSWYGSLVSP